MRVEGHSQFDETEAQPVISPLTGCCKPEDSAETSGSEMISALLARTGRLLDKEVNW